MGDSLKSLLNLPEIDGHQISRQWHFLQQ